MSQLPQVSFQNKFNYKMGLDAYQEHQLPRWNISSFLSQNSILKEKKILGEERRQKRKGEEQTGFTCAGILT